MKHYKHSIIAFFAVMVIGVPWLIKNFPASVVFIDKTFNFIQENLASVFFHESITVAALQDKYNAVNQTEKKVRIMLVPGHEPNYGGAEYGGLKERDMVLSLSKELQGFLGSNSHYEVMVARDEKGWNTDLNSYFNDHWNEIISFVRDSKSQMISLLSDGSVKKITDGVTHNNAPNNVALRLYGINKWSNENNIDIAIHIHFNDYPRRNQKVPGEYSGFAIYVPEKQYSNSPSTKAIADNIFNRLKKYSAVSDLPKENAGVVEEQDLIAIGSYNTADAPSMLIEYGYMYEPQFSDKTARDATLKDLAFQTYLGIEDFFSKDKNNTTQKSLDIPYVYDTTMLPHEWNSDINSNSANKNDILSLQSALILDGVYPPSEKTKNDCPRTGKFGPCTIKALLDFQIKYGVKGEVGFVGEQTRLLLNSYYSAKLR